MANLVALNNLTHRVLRVAAGRARREYAAVNAVSVLPREFQRLVAHYPIFFAKSPESGRLEPVALMGFSRGENLFLADIAREDAVYVPLQVQRHPFALIPRRDDGAGTQPTLDLALDMSSPYVQAREGERLFQDDGQPTAYLQTISSIMQALVAGSREAYAFTDRLTELNLLEPVRVDISFIDSSDTKLQGLYWIAAAALKALSAGHLAELRDREYLEWLYFQMASLTHVSGLVARKNLQLSGTAPVRSGVGEMTPH